MPQFSVIDLKASQLDSAYPLVRTFAPEVPLKRWRDYGKRLLKDGGMLGLAGAEGMLFGVLSYRKQERLPGPVLKVDDFVTFELSRAAPGRRMLCEAAEGLARDMGCVAVELRLSSRGFVTDDSSRALGWTSVDHRPEAVILAKQVPTGPKPHIRNAPRPAHDGGRDGDRR